MKNLDSMPTPTELMDYPQLAVLVALETTLISALRALLAAHPTIFDDTFPRTIQEHDHWAAHLIYLGGELGSALRKYNRALKHDPCTYQDGDPAF